MALSGTHRASLPVVRTVQNAAIARRLSPSAFAFPVTDAAAYSEHETEVEQKRCTFRVMSFLACFSFAGGRYAQECTLILTEGDSAKTSCLAGLSVVGREKYGVFPLRVGLIGYCDVFSGWSLSCLG